MKVGKWKLFERLGMIGRRGGSEPSSLLFFSLIRYFPVFIGTIRFIVERGINREMIK